MDVTKINGVVSTPTPSKKRMSLDNIQRGRLQKPFRILVYGAEKAGKSTFAAGAPSPIWLGPDSGTDHLDISRMPQPESWSDVLDGVTDVESRGKGLGFQTLVVDPVGWLEPFIHVAVTGDVSIPLATWEKGFGKGFSAALEKWRVLLAALERVRSTGLNVLLIGHAKVKTFNDPEGPGYERYELALENKEAAGAIKQWVDHILFTKRESFGKIDPTSKKAKAYGSAARMLYTEWVPAYDAGNRASLPPELPLSWPTFADALTRGEARVAEMRTKIESGLAELADPEVEKKVREWLAQQNVDVEAVANAVAAKLGEKRSQADGEKQ